MKFHSSPKFFLRFIIVKMVKKRQDYDFMDKLPLKRGLSNYRRLLSLQIHCTTKPRFDNSTFQFI